MTKSFGPAIRTTAYLAEKFKIPFVPYGACGAFTDKTLMKSIFQEHGIVTSRVIDSGVHGKKEKFTAAEFPLIFKPNTGHAKKGVKLIKTPGEMNTHVKEAARGKSSYIIEEFVRGDEIIALGIVNKKEFHLVDITDKETTPPPFFVDLRHIAPSVHEDLFPRIQHIGQKVAQAFFIDTSPLVMEFIVTKEKELYLIEAVPEFGGEFLTDVLVPARTGYNFIAETIKACTGTGFRPPAPRKNRKAAVVQ